ncbi:unnamed protein product [Agarophyton chilense]
MRTDTYSACVTGKLSSQSMVLEKGEQWFDYKHIRREGITAKTRDRCDRGMFSSRKVISSPLPAHVRIKRMRETFFVTVDLQDDNVLHLRERAAYMMGVQPDELRLCRFCEDGTTPEFLEDEQTLAECALTNDDVIHAVVLKNSDWEVPYVTPFPREKRSLVRR